MTARITGLAAFYLGAIVAANLIVTANGPWITPYVAFALIGADLTIRDELHESLSRSAKWLAIGSLIATGGLLSYLLNADAALIAKASVIAFTAAAVVDTIGYEAIRRFGGDRDDAVTGSNLLAAAVDSILFLWIAFGVVNGITWVQFLAKVAGGAFWWFLIKVSRRAVLARNA
jgi:queuosine precursor transporter